MNTNLPTFFLPAIFSSLAVVVALTAIISARVSRPDLFFSYTVDPGFRGSPEGRRILARYTWTILLATVVGIGLFWWGGRPEVSLGLLGPCYLLAYLKARRQAAPHQVTPSTQREAAVLPRETRLAGGWQGQAGPLLILAGCAVYLWLNWNEIPARFPIHWGLDGQPNGWATRGPSAFFLPLTGALTCLLLAGFSYLTTREARRVHTSGPAGERETRNLRNVQRLLLGINYWLAILFGGLSLLPLFTNGNHFSPGALVALTIGGEVVLISIVILVAMKAGQGGWRLKTEGAGATASGTVAVGDRTPDECWKGGLIYWNPNDPAMLVEKRFGYGWTLNFGNVRSWLVLGGIILFSVGISVLSIVLAK